MSTPWTTDDIPDLTGKIVVVTGGNSGIGYEAAKMLAAKGAHTVLACRNPQKAEAALNSLRQAVPNGSAETMTLDLASLDSVRTFSADYHAKFNQLDILVNNAGIMAVPYATTEDGFESQLGVNHLGHFALTGLLFDLLKQSDGARIINISSNAHKAGKMHFDNIMFAEGDGYSAFKAYGQSKLANMLFTYELQRRCTQAGLPIVVVAAHPGGSNTSLGDHMTNNIGGKLAMAVFSRLMQSAEQGAWPTVRAATDPAAKGGQYYGPAGFMEVRGRPVLVKPNKAARNPDDAQQLWALSEQLTGIQYP